MSWLSLNGLRLLRACVSTRPRSCAGLGARDRQALASSVLSAQYEVQAARADDAYGDRVTARCTTCRCRSSAAEGKRAGGQEGKRAGEQEGRRTAAESERAKMAGEDSERGGGRGAGATDCFGNELADLLLTNLLARHLAVFLLAGMPLG